MCCPKDTGGCNRLHNRDINAAINIAAICEYMQSNATEQRPKVFRREGETQRGVKRLNASKTPGLCPGKLLRRHVNGGAVRVNDIDVHCE